MPIDRRRSGPLAAWLPGTRRPQRQRGVRGLLALAVVVGLLGASPAAAQPAPAELVFTITPTQVDASAGGVTVAIGFTFAAGPLCLESCDDLASATQVRLVQPGSGQVLDAAFAPVVGSPIPNRFEALVAFPPSIAPGVWEVEELLIVEADGRRTGYDKAALDGVGAPTEVLNTSPAGDDAPPELLALGVAPPAVDTSAGEQTVTATATFTHTQSGPCIDDCADSGSPSLLRFAHGPSGQVRDAPFVAAGGDQLDATGMFQMPSAPGTWEVAGVALADEAGSRQHYDAARLLGEGLDASFENQSLSGDVAAPEVDGVSLDPEMIDTSAGGLLVTFTATLLDPGSGVCASGAGCDDGGSPTQVRFFNPVSGQVRHASLARVSGTAQDGVYQGQALLPMSSAGEFEDLTLLAADVQGNRRVFQVPEPASGGLFAVLTVVLLRIRRRRSSA